MFGHIAHEASQRHMELYDEVLSAWQQRSGRPPKVLDFGTGRCGAGRVFLEPRLMRLQGELHLFDTQTDILRSCYNGTATVGGSAVYGPRREHYDIINLSYVLGTMPEAVAGAVLRELKANHPRAIFVVVDYIMRYRSKVKVLETLNTNSEMRARQEEGDERFAAMRSQHDVASLEGILRGAGLRRFHKANILDRMPSRVGIVASEDFPRFEHSTPEEPQRYDERMCRRVRSMIAYALGKCTRRIANVNARKPIEALACELQESMNGPRNANADGTKAHPEHWRERLAERQVFETSCLLEERLQTAISAGKKIQLPMLKARKDAIVCVRS